MKLRIDADTDHEDPEYWYDAYGAHISTESSGDVRIQEIDPEWLMAYADDEALVAAHKGAHTSLTDKESADLISRARTVWDAACDLHYYRERAVDAYHDGDLEGVVEWLKTAEMEERQHGYAPAASALRKQLLEDETA